MAMADAGAAVGGATELTGISFRDQLWLNSFPLDRALVFDYFALSPFYDPSCNNQQLRMRSIHPLDISHLSKMTGMEYMLYEVQEPNFFVFRKQKRDSPEKVTPTSAYYVLDGSIYQAPNLHNVIGSRVVRSLYHIAKAFSEASAKLEKIGYDNESAEGQKAESKSSEEGRKGVEMINMKEALRVDRILDAIHRKLPPAPPPPPLMPMLAADTAPSSQNEGAEGLPAQQGPTASASGGGPDTSILGKQQQKAASVEQPSSKRIKSERP